MRFLLLALVACVPLPSPAPVSSIYAQDTFTGASAVTSGVAPNPATTNVTEILYVSFVMPPTAGDQFDWVVTFPTGTVTARLRFTSATQLVFERVVTIGGTSTTNIATYNSPTGNFPLNGAWGHLHFRVTRNTGPVTTTFTLGWRGTESPSSASTSVGFTLSGLLTPTSAAFAITGSAPVMPGADIDGRVPDGGGNPILANGAWNHLVAYLNSGLNDDGIFRIEDGVLRNIPTADFNNDFAVYTLAGVPSLPADYSTEIVFQIQDDPQGPYIGIVSRAADQYFYVLAYDPSRFWGTFSQIEAEVRLYKIKPGGADYDRVDLATPVVIPTQTPLDTDITLRLCTSTVGGVVELQGYLNGELLIEGEDDGSDSDIYEAGDPGVVIGFDGFLTDPHYGLVSRVIVAAQDDGNPGGGGGSPGTEAFLWPRRNQEWRPVPTPGPDTDAVQVQANLAPRIVRAAYVRANLAFRTLPTSTDPNITGDPGDGVPDVGCIDVTTVAPPGPVDPLGTRLFYQAMLPDALYGDGTATPFNATTEPMGDFILNRLAAAASTGMIILGTQGGYTKFRTGGNYDPDKMDDFIDAHGAISAALEAYFIAGQFYGVSIADDFESSSLWPPSGLSVTELKRIAARWKSVLSWGLRVSIRGRPTQFSGEDFSGYIDNCRAQYTSRHGDPETWRDNEVAACASINVGSILWSLNWTKGGPSGGAMSAAQIVDVGTALSDPATEALGIANHGGGGWRYDSATYGSQVAAYVTYRNMLAAL